jgi:hypothetical protein
VTPLEASKVLAMLMAAYPNARVPDGTVALYESFLVEYDRDRCVRAVRTIITTSKFMPTIAEIVTAYEGQAAATDEVPYHRRFRPPRERPRMKPREVQAVIAAALKAMEQSPATAPAESGPGPDPKEPVS